MLRFIVSVFLTALAVPIYLRWATEQADAQIDKMQEAAFNTPGAESPVTPSMFTGALSILGVHFMIGRRILRLRTWQAALSFLMGLSTGFMAFFWTSRPESP